MEQLICGPTYKDQQEYRKTKIKDKYSEQPYSFDDIYDIAVKNTEAVYEERLRNKLSPITNLICLTETYFNEDNLEEKQKLYKIISKIKPWESSNMAVEQILTIPKQ